MADWFGFLLMLITGASIVIGTPIVVSAWRLESRRKWFFLLLTYYVLAWGLIVEGLFPVFRVRLVWQNRVEGVLCLLLVSSLVLLYRHRRDPDPSNAEVP